MARSGEKRWRKLLLRIIMRAIYDWVSWRGSKHLDRRRVAAEAYSWLYLEKPGHPRYDRDVRSGYPFTLIGICAMLECDIDQIRRRALHVRAGDVLTFAAREDVIEDIVNK